MKVLPDSWNKYVEQFRNVPASYFDKIPPVGTTKKFCVMIEPRKHPLLIPVIKNFMYILQNKGYGLIMVHGTTNKAMVERENIPNIAYINIGKQNMTLGEYNLLLKNSSFWNRLLSMGCEHALIFQTDTLLLKDNLDDFLQYDYIGAPWYTPTNHMFTNSKLDKKVGNGGLSLRNTRKMIYIIDKMSNKNSVVSSHYNEDIFFSFNGIKLGIHIPHFSIAMSFSVETMYHPSPMGMHNIFPDVYTNEELSNILSKKFFTQEELDSFPRSIDIIEYDITKSIKPGEEVDMGKLIMKPTTSSKRTFNPIFNMNLG